MLTMDVRKLPRILGRLVGLDPTRRQSIRRIAYLILPSWVDIEAVRGIVEEGVKVSGDRSRVALRLNAPDERIAELYALRAFPDVQPQWKLLRLTCVFGECADIAEARQQLVSEIENEIRLSVKVRVDARNGDSERERAERLRRCRRLADNRQPVFITAKLGSLHDDLLRYAMTEYDFATFLLRSEIEAHDDSRPPLDLIRPLTPPLSLERYDSFRDLDADLYENLNPDGAGG
jgi:hypothetical protein